MYFEFNRYSGLLLPFFIQGLLFAILLFFRGRNENRTSDWLLGWLLLLNAIKIASWMLGFAGWYDSHNAYTSFMFYFPFNNVLWMGPLLYFYFLSLTNAGFRFKRSHYYHFILPGLFLLMIIAKFVLDFGFHRPFPVTEDTQFGTKGPFADWDKNLPAELLGYLSFFYYLVLTISSFRGYQSYVKENFSNTENISFTWLRNLLYAIAAAVIIFFLFSLITRFVEVGNGYIFDWYSYLTLGIIVYYLSIAGYMAKPAQYYKLKFVPEETIPAEPPGFKTKETPADDNLKTRLLQFMETERPFLEPELTLAQLSGRLSLPPALLSRVINSTGQNFNDFINAYRVEAVVKKLEAGEQATQTLLGIAYDAGFNSKATFNRAFRKFKGMSPKDWKPL